MKDTTKSKKPSLPQLNTYLRHPKFSEDVCIKIIQYVRVPDYTDESTPMYDVQVDWYKLTTNGEIGDLTPIYSDNILVTDKKLSEFIKI